MFLLPCEVALSTAESKQNGIDIQISHVMFYASCCGSGPAMNSEFIEVQDGHASRNDDHPSVT